ncbi:MAG: hypothetical protein Q4D96_04850 [Propionibacteriaceae bacterium]|nr:hypothetical protein [Propionibacteriaceae bacterium]
MRSHRHAIWMILAALFTVSACTAPVPEVGYNPLHPEFSSARELWEAADLVLEGTVTSSTPP